MSDYSIPTTFPTSSNPPPTLLARFTTALSRITSNKLLLLIIFVVVIAGIALTLSIASRARTPEIAIPENPSYEEQLSITSDWIKYIDPYSAYTFSYPPVWKQTQYSESPESTKLITTLDGVSLFVKRSRTQATSLEQYLTDLDGNRAREWSGQPSRVIGDSAPIKVGEYPGFERREVLSENGVEFIVAYTMVDSDVFTFSLTPADSEKSVSNQNLVRQFRLLLTTFKITDKANRLATWKIYESQKIPDQSYPTFRVSFPATWSISDPIEQGALNLIISRNGYKIYLSQASVGNAVCLFKDSPSFAGSSGDLKSREFTEFKTNSDYILRRYFKGNEGDNSIFLFCGKKEADTYFQTPLSVGGVTYTVPARYDESVIKEMDNIVKTLEAR